MKALFANASVWMYLTVDGREIDDKLHLKKQLFGIVTIRFPKNTTSDKEEHLSKQPEAKLIIPDGSSIRFKLEHSLNALTKTCFSPCGRRTSEILEFRNVSVNILFRCRHSRRSIECRPLFRKASAPIEVNKGDMVMLVTDEPEKQ